MRRIDLLMLSIIILLSGCTVPGAEERFPSKEIEGIEVVELFPNYLISFDDYNKKDLKKIEEYQWWSTLHPIRLTKFKLTTFASSTLNNSESYKSDNLCDGKIETAWVEGAKGDGIGEWVKVSIDAYSSLSEFTSTPFSLDEIAIMSGYGKSEKTWVENNRVKKLLVVAYSPRLSENEWVIYRLNLQDENKMQVFEIPNDKIGYSFTTMKKVVWLKIEEVYKGTKYEDTCISEFVAVGGFTN